MKVQNSLLVINNLCNKLKKQISILKKKILSQAFEGKLIPQDPNDEPASVLVEKIKKEKEQLIQHNPKRRKKNVK